MLYTDFIKNHLADVRSIHRRYPPLENYDSTKLDALCQKSESFKRAVERINDLEDKCVDRDIIFKIFNESSQDNNLLEGFWITLLWGNLSIKNLNSAITDEPALPENRNRSLAVRLQSVLNYIKAGNLKGSFSSLSRGRNKENKIKGVDISFFTKLLYFLKDYCPPNMKYPKPLIYDKWTRGIDAALIAEKIEPESSNYILHFGPRGGFSTPSFPTGLDPFQMYLNYLTRMDFLAHKFEVPSDKLEEFLFGESMLNRMNWNRNNPRYVLLFDYLRSLCKYNPPKSKQKENGHIKEEIKAEQKLPVRNTRPLFGWHIKNELDNFYLFVASSPKGKKLYCEIYSTNGKYSKELKKKIGNDLEYTTSNKRYPIFIRRFQPYEVDKAKKLMKSLEKRLC